MIHASIYSQSQLDIDQKLDSAVPSRSTSRVGDVGLSVIAWVYGRHRIKITDRYRGMS